VIESIWWK